MNERDEHMYEMHNIKTIDHLTSDILQDIVKRIVVATHPEKIILFGSHAYGQPKKESDLDILIIKKTGLPRHKRSIPVYDALRGLIIPKDIIVHTPEEVKEWAGVPQSCITSIVKRGRVLYEKQA
jgi:predicted nucleotidyltransferase